MLDDDQVYAGGLSRTVASNTATQITLTASWSPRPANGVAYAVASPQVLASGGGSASYGAGSLTDPSQSFRTNELVGDIVVAGSAYGIVASNDATTITLLRDWANGTPAAATSYAVNPVVASGGGATCLYYSTSPSHTSANCPAVPAPAAMTNSCGQLGTTTVVVDPRGARSTCYFDSAFRTLQITDPRGGQLLSCYDSNNNRVATLDQNQHATAATYDANGNVLTKTDALNHTWTYTYNAFNEPLTVTGPIAGANNPHTGFSYDGVGNLTSVTDGAGNTTTYTPNSDGTLASMTDALNKTTSFGYDAYRSRTTVTDPLNHVTSFEYDAGGRLTSVTDPLGDTTTYTYDAFNHALTSTDALDRTTQYAYDPLGRNTTVTDVLDQDTVLAYDTAGRTVAMTDPAGDTTTYAYDGADNLTAITNADARVTSYAYDANGNLATVKDPRHQASGEVAAYTYDAANQLLNVAQPDVNYATAFTYDEAGRRHTITDTRGVCCGIGQTQSDTTTYGYDGADRLTSVQTTFGSTKTVAYTYDAGDNRTSITYPDGKMATYTYDELNRVHTVVASWLTGTTTYTPDDAGRPTSTALANGLTVTRGFDDANRLISVTNKNGGATLSSFVYTPDAVGNRRQAVDGTGTTQFDYDDLDRLKTVSYPNADAQAFTYDGNGNRLTMTFNGVPTTYGYSPGDLLTDINGVNTASDLNGNLTMIDADNTFLYDEQNRLLRTGPCRGDVNDDGAVDVRDLGRLSTAGRFGAVEGSAGYDVSFDLNGDNQVDLGDLQVVAGDVAKQCKNTGANTGNGRETYNGEGLRVRERTFPSTGAAVNRDFTWDEGSSLPEILQETRTPDGGAAATVTYLYGGDGLIASTDSGANRTAYYLQDGLGSTAQLADTSGAVTDGYTYDAFGALRTTTGTTANDFRFTGQQQDAGAARGLYYLRARAYDPALGRFLQRDPMPSVQRYVYASSDPVNRTDPAGLDDRTPTPVPLPAAGSASAFKRCKKGFEDCVDILAPQERALRAADPDHVDDEPYLRSEKPFSRVCVDFLDICLNEMRGGNPYPDFDMLGAQQRMRDMVSSFEESLISRAVRSIGNLAPPSTGSGGFLNSGSKEGGFKGGLGCLP